MVKSVVAQPVVGNFVHEDPSAPIPTASVVSPPVGTVVPTGSHVFGYDGAGNLATDTWTIDGSVYVKTYGYTAGLLTAESDWVQQ